MAERELAERVLDGADAARISRQRRDGGGAASERPQAVGAEDEKATLYLCLPATRMGTHARWLRVIINLALVAFERTKAKTDIPVLMVLDEFAVLGHMKSVEMAAGLMAGFGVKLWVVLQDLTQIKRLYKESWETFIGNAGVTTFWSNSDKTTLDYMSDKLGQTGVRLQQPNDTTLHQRLSGASGVARRAARAAAGGAARARRDAGARATGACWSRRPASRRSSCSASSTTKIRTSSGSATTDLSR